MQINLNHCEAAQDLLMQTVIETKVDVVLISEPYKKPSVPRWWTDKSQTAVLWVRNNFIVSNIDADAHDGFVSACVNGITIYSCYLAPSINLAAYQNILDHLTHNSRGKDNILIGGDFNALAVEWGSKRTSPRAL